MKTKVKPNVRGQRPSGRRDQVKKKQGSGDGGELASDQMASEKLDEGNRLEKGTCDHLHRVKGQTACT